MVQKILTWLMFHLLRFDAEKDNGWLSRPAREWSSDGNYQAMAKYVKHLPVANDPAERSVKLIQDFLIIYEK